MEHAHNNVGLNTLKWQVPFTHAILKLGIHVCVYENVSFTDFLNAAVYEVGTTVSLSCEVNTIIPPTSVRWESGGILVNQTMGVNHVSLPLLPVKDDHHEQLFICSGYDGPTPIYRIYLTVIVQGIFIIQWNFSTLLGQKKVS